MKSNSKKHPLVYICSIPIVLLLSIFGLPIVLTYVFEEQFDRFLNDNKIDAFSVLVILIGSELSWLLFVGFMAALLK